LRFFVISMCDLNQRFRFMRFLGLFFRYLNILLGLWFGKFLFRAFIRVLYKDLAGR